MTKIDSHILFSHTLTSIGWKKCMKLQTLKFLSWNFFCRNTFFERWQILIVFFHIHFVILIQKKCIQFQTLNFFKCKFLSWYIFWKVLKIDSLLPHMFRSFGWKKFLFKFEHWIFLHWSFYLDNLFFERWQKLIVFFHFHVYFVSLVEKSIFISNTEFVVWEFLPG